ncbi:MAG: lipoprotein insertase outer membrane protein LolB [Gammaproteobacteria bacterium]
MFARLFVTWLPVLMLAGCTVAPVHTIPGFDRAVRDDYYRLTQWVFDGRIAAVRGRESWTANITWKRHDADENIRLAGPLGQGGLAIRISDHSVFVDSGEGEVEYYHPSDDFIAEELGFYVPLGSLHWWVVGLADPESAFTDITNGFVQNGWTIRIRELQQTELGLLPRKMQVSSRDVKLKLIIDQWRKYE